MDVKLPEIFSEEEYTRKMQTDVAAWRAEHLRSGFLDTQVKLHYVWAEPEHPAANIVISHGYIEFEGKFHEMLYYFCQMGFRVFLVEHRGHGRSSRETDDPYLVYVRSYDDYLNDLKAFVDEIVLPKCGGQPMYIFGQSMGGLIAALFLERFPGIFQKAVLSSPMMGLNMQGMSPIKVRLVYDISALLHWNTKRFTGPAVWQDKYDFEGSNDTSRPRYDYQFYQRKENMDYRTCSTCFAWARASIRAMKEVHRNAKKADVPILLFQAETDSLIDLSTQNEFAEEAPNVTLIKLAGTKHGLPSSPAPILEIYYRKMFEFLF